MALELNIEHPDYHHKVNDARVALGKTYKFGENQFVKFWRAGPKDGTVVCCRNFPHGSPNPYIVGHVTFSSFEAAADAARKGAKREYDKALDIVRRYEAPEKE